MTLYDLSTEYIQLRDLLTSGVIDEQTLQDNLEGIDFKNKLEEKATGYGKIDQEIGAGIDIITDEIKRLKARKCSLENSQKRLREYMTEAMISMGLKTVRSPLFTFTVQDNQPAVHIEEDAIVPDKFLKISYTVDKLAIKDALKAGEVIDGCTLVQSRSLRIR